MTIVSKIKINAQQKDKKIIIPAHLSAEIQAEITRRVKYIEIIAKKLNIPLYVHLTNRKKIRNRIQFLQIIARKIKIPVYLLLNKKQATPQTRKPARRIRSAKRTQILLEKLDKREKYEKFCVELPTSKIIKKNIHDEKILSTVLLIKTGVLR